MFKFGIKEKVKEVIKTSDGVKEKFYFVRGRAEFEGYNEFNYMVQKVEDYNEDSLDFTKCIWRPEGKLEKI